MEHKQDELTHKVMDAFFQLYRLHRHQKRSVQGIKHSEMMVLFRIKKHSGEHGVKVSEISHHLKVTPPTVSQLINTLEENGLIKRSIDSIDRRSIRVKLTEKGEAIVKRAFDALYAKYNGLVETLGKEKSITLVNLLTDSIKFLSQYK